MLSTDRFKALAERESALGRSVPDTLRAYGLNVYPDVRPPDNDDGSPGMTDDEEMLTGMATHTIGKMIESMGNVMAGEALMIEGMMMGLAFGYAQGLEDGAEAATTQAPDTLPEDWGTDAAA